MSELRDYQRLALERSSELTALCSSILIVSPTGTGKTRIAVEACIRHAQLGGLPMFVAPRRELVAQTRLALAAAGLHEHRREVCVATIQGLTAQGAKVPPATLVVLDEARHYVADEWSKLKEALPDAFYLGIDATPERSDGRGLAPFFQALVEAISVRDAIAGGWIVPCETIRPDRALGRDLAATPIDAWLEHAGGAPTVVFERSVEEAKSLADCFRYRGTPAAAVWGDMPSDVRDRALANYASGELSVLVNVQLLTEGWDCPRTEVVVLAAPCSTQGALLQRAGRAMRPFPGKKRMLLLDPTGCTHTLGDVDEPRTWNLDGRAARRDVDDVEIRFCPICGAPTETKECLQCGHAGELRKRKPRILGLPMQRFARERMQTDEEKAKRLAGYLRVARAKGRKPWWGSMCFKGVYGHLPSPALMTMARRML